MDKEQSNDTITNAQKSAFAIANKLAELLGKQGINKTQLRKYIKQKYEVESKNDMTELQWTELSAVPSPKSVYTSGQCYLYPVPQHRFWDLSLHSICF